MNSEPAERSRRTYRMAARAEAAMATENRVLDVALQLFTDHPYEAVSLEDIAAKASVTKRTVLRRFATKEALFFAAMERAGREEMRRRDEAPVGDVPAAVTNVLEHYERFGANRLRVLAEEDSIPVVAEVVAAGRRFHWSWVERTFAPLLEPITDQAERRRRTAGLVALTDVYTWRLLRRDLGLSTADTHRLLVELIENLKGDT